MLSKIQLERTKIDWNRLLVNIETECATDELFCIRGCCKYGGPPTLITSPTTTKVKQLTREMSRRIANSWFHKHSQGSISSAISTKNST